MSQAGVFCLFFTGGCVFSFLPLTLVTLKVPLKVRTTTSVANKSLTMLLCAQHVALCSTACVCTYVCVFQFNVTSDWVSINLKKGIFFFLSVCVHAIIVAMEYP